MNCDACDKLFRKIHEIDLIVKDCKQDTLYWERRLNYLRFTNVSNTTIDTIIDLLEQAEETLIRYKEKQRKRHRKLCKHYREVHLNG